MTLRSAAEPSLAHLVSAVLLQTVHQPAGVGQPERHHLEVGRSPLRETEETLAGDKFPTHHHGHTPHLDDSFDAADGGVEQSADSLVVVDAVCVSDAHEDDVGRKSGQQIDRYSTRLQIWEDQQYVS